MTYDSRRRPSSERHGSYGFHKIAANTFAVSSTDRVIDTQPWKLRHASGALVSVCRSSVHSTYYVLVQSV